MHTKPTARHSPFFAIFVVCCSQLIVAEDLVCFANLSPHEPRHPTTTSIDPQNLGIKSIRHTCWNFACAVSSPGFLSGLALVLATYHMRIHVVYPDVV
jgi:hypothetical protein